MQLRYAPCIFCVENEYQILLMTDKPAVARILVDGVEYSDAFNGVYPTQQDHHKITVPVKALDTAGEYTASLTEMVDRKPYFPVLGEVFEKTWRFDPVPEAGEIRIFHVADAHSHVAEPVAASNAFCEEPDLLFFNGDIANKGDTVENILTLPMIADAITHGNKPVVFARGNHDTRGAVAPLLGDYMGLRSGKTYFTFRLGSIWGVVLDCGEDKPDHHEEYNGTVNMAAFRREQTMFLHQLLEEKPYEAEGIRYRLCLCHIPFTRRFKPPFDIERDTYGEWIRCLNEMKINALLSGHDHRELIVRPGDPEDAYGQQFPTLILSRIDKPDEGGNPYIVDAGLTFSETGFKVTFTDSLGKQLKTETF